MADDDDPPRPLSSDRLRVLRSLPGNDICVECYHASVHPDWASITYGTLLCLQCAGLHRGLGVHLSFVRSLTMDSWTNDQYGRMTRGGNARFRKSMGYPPRGGGDGNDNVDDDDDDGGGGCATNFRSRYEGDGARLYRDRLSVGPIEDGEDDEEDFERTTNTVSTGWCKLEDDDRDDDRRSSRKDATTAPPPLPPTSYREAYYDLIVRSTRAIVMKSTKAKFALVAYVIAVGMASIVAHSRICHGRSAIVTSAIASSSSSSLPRVNLAVEASSSYHRANSVASPQTAAFACHRPYAAVVVALGMSIALLGLPMYLLRRGMRQLAFSWHVNRQEGFNSSRNLLADLVKSGRARRMASCDAYYPPIAQCGGDGTDNAPEQRTARFGLILFPGALVDASSYSHVSSLLSDMGILVVVINLEPHRLVLTTIDYPLREVTLRAMCDAMLSTDLGVWTVNDWAVGGHSLGGALAIAAIANELHTTVKKVVLWGILTYPSPIVYPCMPLREVDGVDALVVNGSEDGIVCGMDGSRGEKMAEKSIRFEASMPPKCNAMSSSISDPIPGKNPRGRTLYVTIEGANHSGFAHYGPQTYPVRDGTRTITLQEQQRIAAEVTADFLLGGSGGGSGLKVD